MRFGGGFMVLSGSLITRFTAVGSAKHSNCWLATLIFRLPHRAPGNPGELAVCHACVTSVTVWPGKGSPAWPWLDYCSLMVDNGNQAALSIKNQLVSTITSGEIPKSLFLAVAFKIGFFLPATKEYRYIRIFLPPRAGGAGPPIA